MGLHVTIAQGAYARRAVLLLALLLAGCAPLDSGTGPAATGVAVRAPADWSERPDFAALRETAGRDGSYSIRCDFSRAPIVQSMVGAMNERRWDEAAMQGREWLVECPVDIRVHYYTGIAYTELGDLPNAEDHYQWAAGLMDSIVASGDGESPETAYVTISVAEEYDALMMFGLEPITQSLVSTPVMCDRFVTKNEEGEEFIIYFNPAAHFARLEQMFR